MRCFRGSQKSRRLPGVMPRKCAVGRVPTPPLQLMQNIVIRRHMFKRMFTARTIIAVGWLFCLLLRPFSSVSQSKSANEVSLGSGPTLGSASAPVTIIEFSDFQCGFCKRFWAETLPKLKRLTLIQGRCVLFIGTSLFSENIPSKLPWRRSAPQSRGNSGSITTSYSRIREGWHSPKPSLNNTRVISA